MRKPRSLKLSDLRLSYRYEVIAAPLWAFWWCPGFRGDDGRWIKGSYVPEKATWARVKNKLKRLRDEWAARADAQFKETKAKHERIFKDTNASDCDRHVAAFILGMGRSRASNPEASLRTIDLGRNSERWCRVCQGSFLAFGKTNACSDACARKRRKATRTQGKPRVRRVSHEPRRCEFCEIEFIPRRADARFHSVQCRIAQHRRKAQANS